MIPFDYITEWRAQAPWTTEVQVEQDLVLSRVLVELFSQEILRREVAFRGGTALHKLFLDAPERYSEDIDLVQIPAEPIGGALDAIRRALDPWLGKPQWKKGRDLFDLWSFSRREAVDSARLVQCFLRYIENDGLRVSRAELEANLHGKLDDTAFQRDIEPLLATGTTWDHVAAAQYVLTELAPLLPGEPWKGTVKH